MKPMLTPVLRLAGGAAVLLLLFVNVMAQPPGTALQQRIGFDTPKGTVVPQVIYYPFYNGVQLIEIDLVGIWLQMGYPERAVPRANDWETLNPAPINPLLIRDTTGHITAVYNTFQKYPAGGRADASLPGWEKLRPADLHSRLEYDSPGRALTHYNSEGKAVLTYELLPPGQAAGQAVPHRQRLYRREQNGVTPQTDSAGRYYIYLDKKVGLIDSLGRPVLPPEYDRIGFLGKAYYLVKDSQAVIASVDFASQRAVNYDELRENGEGLFCVKRSNHYGLINEYGKEITSIKYSACPENMWGHNLLKVWVGSRNKFKFGVVNHQGREVVPPVYERFHAFTGGLLVLQQNGLWGGVDIRGKTVIPHVYDEIHYFIEGLAAAQLNGLWGFIDSTGQTVIPHMYNRFFFFKDGLASVQKMVGGQLRYGLINRRNEAVFPFAYEEAYPFYSGRSLIKLNGKYGYMDSTGRVVIPCIYTQANLFSGGEARVRVGNEEYYIDTNGKRLRAGNRYD